MANLFEDIIEFHKKFKLKPFSKKPCLLPLDVQNFRVRFMQEELDEFKKAYRENNLHDAFDALIDLVYVALGTAYMMGLSFNDGWKEVHTCNLKKIRAKSKKQSKRNSSFDVIKPLGWQKPDLRKFLHGK